MNASLDFGRTFSEVFAIYKERAGVLLPGAIMVFLATAILAGLIDSALDGFLGNLLSNIVSYMGMFLYAGIVAHIVAAHYAQQDMSFGEAFSAVSPVLGVLFPVAILGSFGINLGFLLLIIPGLFLMTRWALLAPVVALERTDIGGAFRRSNHLVQGNSWNVFGILLVLVIGLFVAMFALVAIFAVIGSFIGLMLAVLLALVLVSPLISLVQATMYFELKQIKEGGAPAAAGTLRPGPAAPAPSPPQDTSGSTPPPSAPPPPSA